MKKTPARFEAILYQQRWPKKGDRLLGHVGGVGELRITVG